MCSCLFSTISNCCNFVTFYYGKQISELKSECRKAEQHIQVLNQTLSEGTTQLQSYVTTAQLQSQTLQVWTKFTYTMCFFNRIIVCPMQENIKTLEDSVSNKVLLIEALEVRSVISRPPSKEEKDLATSKHFFGLTALRT